jgi:hypothetical protein
MTYIWGYGELEKSSTYFTYKNTFLSSVIQNSTHKIPLKLKKIPKIPKFQNSKNISSSQKSFEKLN